MSLEDHLPEQSGPAEQCEWDSEGGEFTNVTSREPITDWTHVFEKFNLDPDRFEIISDTVRCSTWQQSKRLANGERDVVNLYSYRAQFRRRRDDRDIGHLIDQVVASDIDIDMGGRDGAFVYAVGDLQLGKADGDGTEGIVRRFRESLAAAVAEAKRHRSEYTDLYLPWLGDCVEGFVSQGGRNAWRTELTLTEQIDLLENLMLMQVKAFAPLARRVVVSSVPGNHDETGRQFSTRVDDSHAVQALTSVGKALSFGRDFDHVETVTPGRDEATTVVEAGGTKFLTAHGHLWRRGKHWEWWEGQTFGRHAGGDADVLLAAHEHHFTVDTRSRRTFIRTPSFESESTWWRHKTGQVGDPGGVVFLAEAGRVRGITIV